MDGLVRGLSPRAAAILTVRLSTTSGAQTPPEVMITNRKLVIKMKMLLGGIRRCFNISALSSIVLHAREHIFLYPVSLVTFDLAIVIVCIEDDLIM